MEDQQALKPDGKRRRVRSLIVPIRWAALLTYLVLLGGTPIGETNGWVQAANGILALGLILTWLNRAPRDTDGLDAAVIVALVLFLTSAALSVVPRQSFGAAIQATALASGFYLARRALAMKETRRHVQVVLGWLCIFVVGVTLPAWVATWISWLQEAGWSQPAPLSLWLPVGSFDNRHYIGTLTLLLAPALWTEAFRQRWAIVSAVGTIGAAGVVLIDASRTILAAAIVAAIVVAGMRARSVISQLRGRAGLVGLAIAVPLVLAAVALAPLIVERMTNLPKLMARFTFFGNAIDLWFGHPVAGIGPGGYPVSYFLTDYFASVNYAPRHPDNAAAQLIVEAGLLGIASATIIVVAFAFAARGRWRANPAAAWALTAFVVACIGTNPTDFLFLVVPALIWAAILVSTNRGTPGLLVSSRRPWLRPSRLISVATIPVIAAVLFTSGGSIAYQVAGDRYRAGDINDAAQALDAAVLLDPAQALYWRERGALYLAIGDPGAGLRAFRRALVLLPWDPAAMRGLALAHMAAGDANAGLKVALGAAQRQPHSVASAIVVAVASLQSGEPQNTSRALSTALLEAPYLGFLSWSDTVLSQFDVEMALATAARSVGGHRAGETGVDAVLLVLMGGAGDAKAAAASGSTISGRALAEVADCDEAAAEREIRTAMLTEREYDYFWIASSLVLVALPGGGMSGPGLAARFVGLPGSPGPATSSLISEGYSDVLRYRHTSLDVVTSTIAMPNVSRGRWMLIKDPSGAMSLVTSWPPSCNRSGTR